MKKILKVIFTKKKKEEKKKGKEVLVINNHDNRCLCERNADDEIVSGFCFKHHINWF